MGRNSGACYSLAGSLQISSVPAKVYHRCLREQLQPTFASHRSPFQGRVLPAQGIEFVALTAKTFFRLCNASQCRAAIIFFDLRAVFYQVLRQLLIDNSEGDAALLQLFAQLKLPPQAVESSNSNDTCPCPRVGEGWSQRTYQSPRQRFVPRESVEAFRDQLVNQNKPRHTSG